MAFQTSVLRDGEWVTETVNFHAALQHASAAAAASAPGPTLDTQAPPPVCGILSRTVVESPIVHWVLPVRLRSKAHNDIAFIGVSILTSLLPRSPAYSRRRDCPVLGRRANNLSYCASHPQALALNSSDGFDNWLL